MTTLHFSDYRRLTCALVTRVQEQLGEIEGVSITDDLSSQSCSAYLIVERTVEYDDGETDDETFKVRFSDHGDRHGADLTLRINDVVDDIEPDGTYVETQVAKADFDRLVSHAVDAIRTFLSRGV